MPFLEFIIDKNKELTVESDLLSHDLESISERFRVQEDQLQALQIENKSLKEQCSLEKLHSAEQEALIAELRLENRDQTLQIEELEEELHGNMNVVTHRGPGGSVIHHKASMVPTMDLNAEAEKIKAKLSNYKQKNRDLKEILAEEHSRLEGEMRKVANL